MVVLRAQVILAGEKQTVILSISLTYVRFAFSLCVIIELEVCWYYVEYKICCSCKKTSRI